MKHTARAIAAVIVLASGGAQVAAIGVPPTATPTPAPAPTPTAPPAPPAPEKPATPPSTPPVAPSAAPPAAPSAAPPAAPPSLDEALGIGGDKPKSDDERARKEALDRSLSEAKPRDLLASAIDGMKRSGSLLGENEAGLTTQRVQESVVKKLDELIAAAQRVRQNQQNEPSSQGSGQQKPGKPGEKPGQKPGEQQGSQSEPGEQQQTRGGRDGKQPQQGDRKGQQGDANANEPPAPVDATQATAQFDETRSEWGRLPARVRDAVRQGMRDPMSASYRRLTQDYYRRMAEEPKR